MKGDFSRINSWPQKHYNKVYMQQGRVQLDADWNEQNDIRFHYETEYLKDLIGKNGTLAKDNGFEISPSGSGLRIGRGHYYVDGMLCENESDVEYSKQPDVLEQSTFNAGRPYLFYLDVWERHITHLDDPYIREQALGNVDTSTRTKIVWQVRTLDASNLGSNRCKMWENVLKKIDLPTTGTLEARVKPSPESTERCSLYETAGYTRLENQLYRIEVHDTGVLGGKATFKWSRENGAVVSRVTKFESGYRLIIEKRGKDDQLDFKKDDWVEITDDLNELHNIPGTFVQLDRVEDTTITYDSKTIRLGDKPIDGTSYPLSRNPKIRRWEPTKYKTPTGSEIKPLIDSTIDKDSDEYIELEDGVQIKLGIGEYRTGDYWLVPARTREGKVEWPTDSNNKPIALGPGGILHHYAPLALLEYKNNKFEGKEDLRSFFSSLTELISMRYAGGDGQQALPDNRLPVPLRVSVTLGKQPISNTPIAGAKVKFMIVTQSPTLGSLRPLPTGASSNKDVDVPPNLEGIAECEWTLGDDLEAQQVKAELYDVCGNKVDIPPIYFNATLPLSFYYVEGDGVEARTTNPIKLGAGVMLGNKPVTTGYKVKFEVVSGGTLPASPVTLDGKGIASAEYLHSAEPRKQAKAVLLHDDGGEINVPPVYFNVEALDRASATTGILELTIPKNNYPLPLRYGPFNHFLEGLDVPPAVMLGHIGEKEKVTVDYTEDYFLTSLLGNEKEIMQFKPVEITKSQFKVELWIRKTAESPAGTTLLLRWWAVPANEQKRQEGKPERSKPIIAFSKEEYRPSEEMTVTVTDPLANKNTDQVEILKISIRSTSDQVGLTKEAIETGANTGIFTTDISPTELKVKVGDTVTAEYVYDSDRVTDTAVIKGSTPDIGISNPSGGTLVLAVNHLDLVEDKVTVHVATDEAPGGIPIVLMREAGTDRFSATLKMNAAEGFVTVSNKKVPLLGLKPGSRVRLIYRYGPDESKSVKSETMVNG